MKIELQNIFFSYNDKPKFENFSYTFDSNNIYCVMGASGGGKTTLLNIIMGLLKLDRGEVVFSATSSFSAVFQENRLIQEMSGYKNIQLCCKLSREKIAQFAKQIGLNDEQLSARVLILSGGEQRRIAILRALLCKSDILIMDEPFNGLDEQTKAETINFVKTNLNERLCVFSTHNFDECKAMDAVLLKL